MSFQKETNSTKIKYVLHIPTMSPVGITCQLELNISSMRTF